MPGPARKASGRQRENTPELGLVPPLDPGQVVIPDPPDSWLDSTVEQWAAWWQSKAAGVVLAGAEEALVLRMFDLLDQAEKLEAEGRKNVLVEGSTGQASINPLLKHAQALRDEARRDEAVLGRGPKRRLDLGIKFGDAHRSLDEVNRRLARGDNDNRPPPTEDPRRVQAVEADSRPA